MKTKHNAGFSLVEVLVAIVLLGTLVVPICSALVLTFRMNEKTDNLLRAQLAVSSAVETLLAEGISEKRIDELYDGCTDLEIQIPPAQSADEEQEKTVSIPYSDKAGRFAEVLIEVDVLPSRYLDEESTFAIEYCDTYADGYDCYEVTVTSRDDSSVSVTTMIREQEVTAS